MLIVPYKKMKMKKNTESNTHDIHLEDISLQEITNTISKERKMGQ